MSKRPSDEQIGVTLQRVHYLARSDVGVYHALRRVTDALVELHCRRSDADYHNALRPADPDAVSSGTAEPDAKQWLRATHPLPEATDARRDHKDAAERLTKLANDLDAMLGWGPPVKGHRDRRGRLKIESTGADGVRRIG